jgi:hypothetical protein
MNAETVFRYCRTYKLYYQGTFDFKKFGGKLPMPPLIQQPERKFYYRIAQKLNDAQIHALFTRSYFFNPRAYVTDLSTPDAFTHAVAFASRAENGRTLLEHDLYALRKRLQDVNVDEWLYGELIDGQRSSTPACLQEVISGELPLDLACLVLLIPQPELSYDWAATRSTRPIDMAFGPAGLLTRLRKLDTLLWLHRTGWRTMTHPLAKEFWASLNVPSLAPIIHTKESVLF